MISQRFGVKTERRICPAPHTLIAGKSESGTKKVSRGDAENAEIRKEEICEQLSYFVLPRVSACSARLFFKTPIHPRRQLTPKA